MKDELETGREAFERGAWRTAHDALASAGRAGALTGADAWRLAVASYLVGEEEDFVRALSDAHHAHLEAEEPLAATRCAFWLGFHFANESETARASGWFGRAARLLEGTPGRPAEQGYLLLPAAMRHLGAGDPEACRRIAREAVAIAERTADADLFALALHLEGRALLRAGRVEGGLALLDEAMVAVANGELSPIVTGLVYCSVIGACREVHDLRRTHEWTRALAGWCDRQPEMVAYRGECRVYRAEALQLRGEWPEATREARLASESLAPGTSAAGLAHYQRAELHRLKGEFGAAEEAYRAASRAGREPQPGLALLRATQGDPDGAAASLARALTESVEPHRRARHLPAFVEVLLIGGRVEEARGALQELEDVADACAPGVLRTVVEQWRGATLLAGGDPSAALPPLRRACREWETLGAPYRAARTRVEIARACRHLGDDETAELELGAAREAFERLGAVPDLTRLRELEGGSRGRDGHGLTPREREVIRQLATGRTNRAIARALSISEKTVARHVANIFAKLGLSTRSAATAYAYEHGLVEPSA